MSKNFKFAKFKIPTKKPEIQPQNPIVEEEDPEMLKVMGFGTFGPKKVIKKREEVHKPTKFPDPNSNPNNDDNDGDNKNRMKTAKKFNIDEMMGKYFEKLKTDEKEPDPEKTDVDAIEDNVKDDKEPNVDEEEEEDDDDDDLIGPPLPPGLNVASENEDGNLKVSTSKDPPEQDSEDDEDDEEYDEDDDNRYKVLPISHEIILNHGKKSVTALALDPNGARLVSGGIDYEVKYWDFQGMDNTLQSFRTIKPCQSHSIKHLEFSSNGELILVVSGSCVAKLIDRDGFVKSETIKGDQYISDMKNTKGHVAMLNHGCWHPMQRHLFATCSNDGTCRLWDSNSLKQHQSLVKPRSQHGLQTKPNVCAFSPLGDLIATGCDDGSVQMWDTRKSFVNCAHLLRDAHQHSTDMTSLMFGYSGTMMATRAMDNTLKLWDMRMVRQTRPFGRQKSEPLHCEGNLYNRYAQTDCTFSPDDRLLMTAVSCDERETGQESGQLRFYSTSTFELMQQIEGQRAVSNIRANWHPKLNQIVTSTSAGTIQMFYDLKRSIRGALLCSLRQKRKRKEVFSMVEPAIITPHALPLFKQERRKSHFVRMIKDRKDPVKSRRPDLPITGAGSGGRIAVAGKTFASFIARNLGVKAKIDDNEDPREALFKHSKEAEANPYWVTPAYQQTQPRTIFAQDDVVDPDKTADDDDDNDDGDDGSGQRKKRKHIPV